MVRKRTNGGLIVFDGPVTIRTIGALYDELSKGLSRRKSIELDVAGVTEVDISFVQLLLAARKSAVRDGKQLSLSAPAEGALLDTLFLGGFVAADGQSLPDRAFWLNEEPAQ